MYVRLSGRRSVAELARRYKLKERTYYVRVAGVVAAGKARALASNGDNAGTEQGKGTVATLVPGNGRDGFRKGGGPP